MKKNLKKLFSSSLALALVFLLSVSAFAAEINADQAKSIALNDAGFAQSQVSALRAEADYDNGQKHFDVEFLVKNADGNYVEYSYEVSASSGKILEKDLDREGAPLLRQESAPEAKAPSGNLDIGKDAAINAAVKHFGLSLNEVEVIRVYKERDDGVDVYDVEFCKGYDVKYSVDVLASNGKVVDSDKDVSRGLADKIELFFELLFARLFAK